MIPYVSCQSVGSPSGKDNTGKCLADDRDRIDKISHASMVFLQVEELVDLPNVLRRFAIRPCRTSLYLSTWIWFEGWPAMKLGYGF